MKEYIEREIAIGAVEYVACRDLRVYSSNAAYPKIMKALNEAPAADVAPVVHAYWKTREEYNDYLWVECSNCGFRVENYKAVKTGMSSTDIVGNKWNACPACCARMDGGNK